MRTGETKESRGRISAREPKSYELCELAGRYIRGTGETKESRGRLSAREPTSCELSESAGRYIKCIAGKRGEWTPVQS